LGENSNRYAFHSNSLLDFTALRCATAISHVPAVSGAMFRTAIMRGNTRVCRTTDGIAVFRSHCQVLVAVQGIANMGFGRRI
jgi:hypothetical protein